MNPIAISNTALLVLGTGSLATSVELARSSNFVGAGIAAVVGIVAVWLYEHLPPTVS